MTKQQITWASKHDWFIGFIGGEVIVYCQELNQAILFNNYQQLREWAGY